MSASPDRHLRVFDGPFGTYRLPIPRGRTVKAGVLGLLTAVGLCACLSPQRHTPALHPPQEYSSSATNAAVSTAADPEGRWWSAFADPLLDTLVASAADANHDIRIAIARVQSARAGVNAATAQLLPWVTAAGATSQQTTSYNRSIRQQLPNIQAEQVRLDVSWEIDLFGSARAARRAAISDAIGADQARRAGVLSAVAETAQQYFELRGAEERRQIVLNIVTTERNTLRLTELRRSRGEASDFDMDRERADLADVEAQLPSLDTLVATTRLRLATLTGRVPGAWDLQLAAAHTTTPIPLGVPVSQPAELLRRRPDILAAEAKLAASGHRRRQAEALRYPQIFISALFGSEWATVNGLDIGRARFTNVAGALALPLFAGGRIQAGIDAASARESEAIALYEQSILRALEDVESAVARFNNDTRRGGELTASVHSREAALARAQSLYKAGQIDLLALLDVERGLLAARLALSTNTTARLTGSVQVYRALGGGWQVFESGRPSSSIASQTSGKSRVEEIHLIGGG